MHELDDEQIAAFRARLLNLRQELTASLGDARTETVELSSAQGRVSRVDALQQQQMALAEKRRNEARLGQIAAALRRIDEDEYGFCTRCGEPIGAKRLTVRPEGALCMGCTRTLGG